MKYFGGVISVSRSAWLRSLRPIAALPSFLRLAFQGAGAVQNIPADDYCGRAGFPNFDPSVCGHDLSIDARYR